MRGLYIIAGLIGLGVTGGCNGGVSGLNTDAAAGASNANDSGAGIGDAGDVVTVSPEVAQAQARCNEAEAGVQSMPTVADVQAALLGRWLYCSGVYVFNRSDAIGLRFDTDGSWRFLLLSSDSTVVDGAGFDNVGTWSVVDISSTDGSRMYMVDMELPGIGGNGVNPFFATTPRKMRINTMMGFADYASLDAP